jgi:hypothetical protein
MPSGVRSGVPPSACGREGRAPFDQRSLGYELYDAPSRAGADMRFSGVRARSGTAL